MRDIYILHRILGFFDSQKEAYYILISKGKVFAVNKATSERRYLGDKLTVKQSRGHIQRKDWIAFFTMAKLKSFILKKELDRTLGGRK